MMQSMGDARDAMMNAAIDMLGAYGNTLTASQRVGQLPVPYSLRLMPLYIHSLMKSVCLFLSLLVKACDIHIKEERKSTSILWTDVL